MLTARSRRVLAARAVASAAALAVAGCGAAGSSASHHPMAEHSMLHATAAPFGADCSMVPASGMGSFHTMRAEAVLAAATHNPLLTTFAAEARKAGLAGLLDSAHGVTIFAPENSAFAKLGHSTMMMLENPTDLAQILKYHIVPARVTAEGFTMVHPLRTLQGGTITPSKMGSVYEVNKADVICGNIATANATVYIINTVLVPMHLHMAH